MIANPSLAADQLERIIAALPEKARPKTTEDVDAFRSAIESAAGRYLRARDQDRVARSRSEQKATLENIGKLANELTSALAGIDDESRFALSIAVGIGSLENDMAQLADVLPRIAQGAAKGTTMIGETRGRPSELSALRIFFAALGEVWLERTRQPVTVRRSDGSAISPAADFMTAVVSATDPNVTGAQICTALEFGAKQRKRTAKQRKRTVLRGHFFGAT
jgi:hypothetical protein